MKKAPVLKGSFINGRKEEENGQVVFKRSCGSYRVSNSQNTENRQKIFDACPDKTEQAIILCVA